MYVYVSAPVLRPDAPPVSAAQRRTGAADRGLAPPRSPVNVKKELCTRVRGVNEKL